MEKKHLTRSSGTAFVKVRKAMSMDPNLTVRGKQAGGLGLVQQ